MTRIVALALSLCLVALACSSSWASNKDAELQAQGGKGGGGGGGSGGGGSGGGGGGGGVVSPLKDASLMSLALSAGTLAPAFAPTTASYRTNPIGVASLRVTARPNQAGATFTVNGMRGMSGVESQSIALRIGTTRISIVVTAQDGKTKRTYTIDVDRTSPILVGLSVSAGAMWPEFSSATPQYDVGPVAATSTTVTATAEDPYATIQINGMTVASGAASPAIQLAPGWNDIRVAVIGRDSCQTVARIGVLRRSLDGITISTSAGRLAYDVATSTYSLHPALVPAQASITVTLDDPTASATIDGLPAQSGVPLGPLTVPPGTSTREVVVTRPNATPVVRHVIFRRQLAGVRGVLPGFDYSTRVAMHGDTAVIGHWEATPEYRGAVRVYRVNRDTGSWEVEADLYPTGMDQAGMQFGWAVAVWDDTIAIGAPRYTTDVAYDGAVFVYRRSAYGWVLEQRLDTSLAQVAEGRFGNTLALYGDTLAVSNGYSVGVWTRTGGIWSERTLLADGVTILGGWYLAMHADTIVFGWERDSTFFVFTGQGDSWTRTATLDGGGQGVCLWGNTLVAGSKIFERVAGEWVLARDVVGEGVLTDGLWCHRAIHGDTLVMSTPSTAAVFLRTASGWVREYDLLSTEPGPYGYGFGYDVAVFGSTLVIPEPQPYQRTYVLR